MMMIMGDSPRAHGADAAECIGDVEGWTIREGVGDVAITATAAGLDDGGGVPGATDRAGWDC